MAMKSEKCRNAVILRNWCNLVEKNLCPPSQQAVLWI